MSAPAPVEKELAELHALVSELLQRTVPPPQGLGYINDLIVQAERLGGRWEYIALQILLGRYHAQDARGLGLPEVLRILEPALVLARELQDRTLIVRILSTLGTTLHRQQRYPEALSAFTECVQIASGIEDPYVRFLVLNNTATFHLSNGSYAEGLELLEQAQDAARASGNALGVAVTRLNQMGAFNRLGQFERTLALDTELRHTPQLPLQYQVIGCGYRVAALSGLGRTPQALHEGQRYLKLAQEFGNPQFIGQARAGLAQALLQRQEYAAALEAALEAQALMQDRSDAELVLDNQKRLSEIYEALHDPAQALHWAKTYQAGEFARLNQLLSARSTAYAVQARLQALEAQAQTERQKNEELSQVIGTLEETKRALEFQLTHDALTGLHNRVSFQREVQAVVDSLQDGELAALVFMDLDNFKGVNDLYGHAAGDDLLVQAARRLQSVHPGLVAGRIGGDEFVLLRRVTGAAQASALAGRMLEVLGEPFLLSTGDVVEISSSAGVALAPRDGRDAEALQQKADQAMYASKRASRGLVRVYSEDIGREREEKVRLENDLRRGVRDGELTLHYQGRFDVLSGQLRGLEALVRWDRPGLGLVPPQAFIPVAEQSPLMLGIGEWVLAQACLRAVAWDFAARDLNMSVNVSIMQFQQPDFVQTVRRALQDTGCPPGVLTLELTETMILRDVQRARLTIAALHGLGLRVAMDDFGTGYSSLGVLRSLPLDTLKIDRAFMEGITLPWPEGGKAQVMLATIIDLAHQLDMRVTAEGVESPEQLAFLRQTGCDYVQGFLLGRPEPAAQVASRLS